MISCEQCDAVYDMILALMEDYEDMINPALEQLQLADHIDVTQLPLPRIRVIRQQDV